MGCSTAIALATMHPETVLSMILWWPVGGARYRMKGRQRFREHLAFVDARGLAEVVKLVQKDGKPFGADPRGGPWASVIRQDATFAQDYARRDVTEYKEIVTDMERALLDRDTAPGAEPEELMRLAIPTLVVPGREDSHATSAARYLEECIPGAQYWDMPPAEQTEASSPARLLEFLGATGEAQAAA